MIKWTPRQDGMFYYTGIGSRDTPQEVLELMRRLGWAMAKIGVRLRSGGAGGADNYFALGAIDALGNVPEIGEIYLPWKTFPETPTAADIVAPELKHWGQAEIIASEIHPAWSRFTENPKKYQAVMKLHTRNVFQILGYTLQNPSHAVYCWAPPQGNQGHVKGGTATAVALGIKHNVKIMNLFYEENVRKAEAFIARVEQWVNAA